MPPSFHIVYVADYVTPSAATLGIVDEVVIAARAGYRVGLLPLAPPANGNGEIVHHSLRACVDAGWASVIDPADCSRSAGLALFPDPTALAPDAVAGLGLWAEHALALARSSLLDHDGAALCDIEAVGEAVHGATGTDAVWAPAWPYLRSQLAGKGSAIRLLDDDWQPVADVERWGCPRDRRTADKPVIGRHALPLSALWPGDVKGFLQLFPLSHDVRVALLGAPEWRFRELGHPPRDWRFFSSGSLSAERFLQHLDFYVAYAGEGLRRGIDNGVVEALASGAVCVLPEVWRPLFGDAALYVADAEDVTSLTVPAFRRQDSYRALSQAGIALAHERHGVATCEGRLNRFVGAPRAPAVPVTMPAACRPNRALFVTSNGIGLGHVTRMMAIALRLGDDVQQVFATMSQGLPVIRQFGFHAEYVPFHGYLECDPLDWRKWLPIDFGLLLDQFNPGVLVYDGNFPFGGLLEAMGQRPEMRSIWCRRAMWQRPSWDEALDAQKYFDMVIEPGELAASRDRGATVPYRDQVSHVDPILLLDEDELLGRRRAREALGLDLDRPAVLVQLGSGNHITIVPAIERIVQVLAGLSGVQIVLAQWLMANRPVDHWAGVKHLSGFPNIRYVRAFDFVISAAGYNSFHELMHFCVPTVFVPLEVQFLDDHLGRAQWAADMGMAECVRLTELRRFNEVLPRMLETATRAKLAAACHANRRPNGAAQAAKLIVDLMP